MGEKYPDLDGIPALMAALPSGGDDTTIIQALLNVGAGGAVAFPNSSYKVYGQLTIPARTTVIFNRTTFTAQATVANGIFSWHAADVAVTGTVAYNANGYATPFFSGTSGGDRFDASNIHANITNANTTPSTNNYLFKILQCNGVKIGGFITTSDGSGPWLVYVDRGSDIDISGVITVTGLNAPSGNGQFAPVMVTESTGTSTLKNVSVHDCIINGGATINSWPLIWIGGNFSVQANTTTNVAVSNCLLSNTTSTADALDIALATYVTVDNVISTTSYVGVDITACTAATVTGCIAYLCPGFGFAAGDPNFVQNTFGVNFVACQSHGCGNGANTAQWLINAPAGKQTSNVHLTDCYSDPLGASTFDIIINGTGTATDLAINGGTYNGGTSGHISDTISTTNAAVYRIRNARGLNPFGNLAGSTPTVPLSTTPLTNNTGYDCSVLVFTGVGVTVSAIAVGGTATGLTLAASSQTGMIRVPAGQTITLTYAGGTPTWSWFAD